MTAAPRRTPAIAFLPLMAPYGIQGGYITVTLAWQLNAAGLAAGPIAALVALSIWPSTWKVLWAPLIDTTLGLKRWYAIGAVLTALSLALFGSVAPSAGNTARLAALIVGSTVASTVVAMATEAMMAATIDDDRRGRAAGWLQSGNLGGMGLGGGLALFVSQQVDAAWLPAAVVGVASFACIAGLPLVRLNARTGHRLALMASLAGLVLELKALLRSRTAMLAIVLMLLPIGSGGAQSLWAAIAGDWHAGAGAVALVDGALGGLASIVGAVAGGWVCDRLDRRTAYCVFGLLVAAVAGAMAVLPRSPEVFVVLTLAYAVALGCVYAALSAVALEAIGRAGGATKYQVLAAASNVPIALETTWDGRLHDAYGATGMLAGEVAFTVGGIALFLVFAAATRRRPVGLAARP